MITQSEFLDIRHQAATDEGLNELLSKLEMYYRLKVCDQSAPEEVVRPPSKSTFSRNSIYDTNLTSYRMNERGQWVQRK